MTLGGALALLLIPLALAYFGGYFGDLPGNDSWRGLLVAPVVIIYIMAIAPRLERMGKSVLNALRSSVLVDDKTFDRIVLKATTVSLRDELLAIGVGLMVGVVSAIPNHDGAMGDRSIFQLTRPAAYKMCCCA